MAPCAANHLPSVSIAMSVSEPFVGCDVMSVTDGIHVGATCGNELDHFIYTETYVYIYINTNTHTHTCIYTRVHT